MASGNTLIVLTPANRAGPATVAATFDTIPGASSPSESIPVLDYDTTTVEYADYQCWMPSNYAGGGITVTVVWSASTATTGNAIFGVALRAVPDDAEDLDTTAFTYDYNDSAAAAAPSAVGETSHDNITFTDGADMDSVGANSHFLLRVRRSVADAGDTMAGDAEIQEIIIKET